MIQSLRIGLVVGLLGFAATAARADMIDASVFSTLYGGNFNSFAFDSSTGTYYSRQGYDGEATLSSYSSDSALAAKTPSGSITLQGGSFFGTYFAVSNGHIYGRSDRDTNAVSEWSATTGALQATGTIPDFGGQNGADTFEWGGYSGVNWFHDSTGLYTLGHVTGGNTWSIHKMDADLNITSTQTFTASTLGYAFIINGELFTSSHFDSNIVDQRLDIATGTVTPVSFQINNLGGLYMSNTLYDPSRDRLYLYNTSSETLFSIDSASSAFRVRSVPEPASLTMLALGGAGLIGYTVRRKRRGRVA